MTLGYTIRSISEEGTYYLVNGWNKNNAFWVKEKDIHKAVFKTEGQAKASLTKLLKVFPEYATDTFKLVRLIENKGTDNIYFSTISIFLLDNGTI